MFIFQFNKFHSSNKPVAKAGVAELQRLERRTCFCVLDNQCMENVADCRIHESEVVSTRYRIERQLTQRCLNIACLTIIHQPYHWTCQNKFVLTWFIVLALVMYPVNFMTLMILGYKCQNSKESQK